MGIEEGVSAGGVGVVRECVVVLVVSTARKLREGFLEKRKTDFQGLVVLTEGEVVVVVVGSGPSWGERRVEDGIDDGGEGGGDGGDDDGGSGQRSTRREPG